MTRDAIPVVEFHRGVGIHDSQPEERIKNIVKPEIDHVLDRLSGITELFEFAGSSVNAPEARMLALAKITAEFELAVEERRARPTEITIERVNALAAMLRRRNPWYFCGFWDVPPAPGAPGPAERDVPLDSRESP
jgi:hypothetical protein